MQTPLLSRKVLKVLEDNPARIHHNQDNVHHMCEVMGFLVKTERPPKDGILWLPALLISEYTLKTVNQAVNYKIKRAKPPH